MPTYEYRCGDCGKSFSQDQSLTEHATARPACPQCGSQNVAQALSTVFVQTSKKS